MRPRSRRPTGWNGSRKTDAIPVGETGQLTVGLSPGQYVLLVQASNDAVEEESALPVRDADRLHASAIDRFERRSRTLSRSARRPCRARLPVRRSRSPCAVAGSNTLRIHVRSHRDRREAVPRRGRHRARGRAARRRARQDDHARPRPARRRRRRRRRSAARSSRTRPSAPRSLRQIRGEKLISFKYRPKARSRVKKGHRQELTVLRISDIALGGKSAAKPAEEGRGRRQDRAPAPRGGGRAPGRQGRRARRQAGRRRQAGAKATAKAKADAAKATGRPKTAKATPAKAAEGRAGQGARPPTAKAARPRPQPKRRRRRPRRAAPQGRAPKDATGQGGCPEAQPRHEEGRVTDMAHKKAGGSSRTAATASASGSASRPATASSSPPARSSSASAA